MFRQSYGGCVKKPYEWEEALEEAKRLTKEEREYEWDVYRCDECEAWHISRIDE